MKVHQNDIGDILKFLPDVRAFDERSFSISRTRLVISTLGFEDRTSWIVQRLASVGVLANASVLLICYPTNLTENLVHLADFEAAALAARGLRRIEYSRPDFSQRLVEALGDVEPGAAVIFDISTCSSYVFFPVMRALVDRDIELSVVYSEAKDYFPTEAEWRAVAERADQERSLFIRSFEEADFQSLGVENVYPYSIFSEMNPGNRPSALVAVPNFSALRMNAIIARDRELNKTIFRNVAWVLGDPPAEENKWRIEAIRLTNQIGPEVRDENIFFASTRDYKDMVAVLEEIWLQRKHAFHFSIGSLGSKMQHLGTFFFLFLHKEVAVWLAEPTAFQCGRFSVGVGSAWHVEFGSLKELQANLLLYMTFGWSF
jgi:hypothetical protein